MLGNSGRLGATHNLGHSLVGVDRKRDLAQGHSVAIEAGPPPTPADCWRALNYHVVFITPRACAKG